MLANRPDTPVLRVKLEGRRRDVEAFDVYGPKAIAGIGDLPATVADRSIPIRLKRRAPDETVARFRRRTADVEALTIVLDRSNVPLVPDVPVPEVLPDRAADSWEVLLSIADVAGEPWPVLGRVAAVALSGEDQEETSVGIRLLIDIREVFATDDHLATSELLGRLHEVDGSPWAEWYGKPLSGRALARLLDPYRVTPTQRRVRGDKSRGYFRVDFEDAWRRYVIPPPAPGTNGTNGTGPDAGDLMAEARRIFADDLVNPESAA